MKHVLLLFRRFFRKRPKAVYSARVTDEKVEILNNDKVDQSILKADIIAVQVSTSDQGPWFDDVFFCFKTRGGEELVVSMGIDQSQDVANFILELPHMDMKKFSDAMTSTTNQTFNVWRKPD